MSNCATESYPSNWRVFRRMRGITYYPGLCSQLDSDMPVVEVCRHQVIQNFKPALQLSIHFPSESMPRYAAARSCLSQLVH